MVQRNKFFLISVGTLITVEVLSYLAYFYPSLNWLALALIGLVVLWLSLKNITWGLLFVIAEWGIGSQGYLFFAPIESSTISLRILLWIIVMAVWFSKEITAWISNKQSWQKLRGDVLYAPQLLVLGFALLIGVAVALYTGNDSGFFFLEAKRWFYIIIWLPLFRAFRTKEDFYRLALVLAAAIFVLALKTFVLIYIFSHSFIPLVYDVYGWMRLYLLGEITRLPNGFARVFMQSQIFLLPAMITFFGFFIRRLRTSNWKPNRETTIYGTLTVMTMCVLIASLSRSFWLGLGGSLLCVGIVYYYVRRPKLQFIGRVLLNAFVLSLISALVLFMVVRFPYPDPTAQFDASLLTDRTNPLEAGAASRWSLLPVMWHEIRKAPLFGYGFGKTITYRTEDPRIVSTTADGLYTTYAFEWGWLDIWLKLGIVGLFAYSWLLSAILRDGLRIMKTKPLRGVGIMMSVIALAIVHFFTPYLNHPLGFGYLGIVMLIARRYNTVAS